MSLNGIRFSDKLISAKEINPNQSHGQKITHIQ